MRRPTPKCSRPTCCSIPRAADPPEHPAQQRLVLAQGARPTPCLLLLSTHIASSSCLSPCAAAAPSPAPAPAPVHFHAKVNIVVGLRCCLVGIVLLSFTPAPLLQLPLRPVHDHRPSGRAHSLFHLRQPRSQRRLVPSLQACRLLRLPQLPAFLTAFSSITRGHRHLPALPLRSVLLECSRNFTTSDRHLVSLSVLPRHGTLSAHRTGPSR